MSPLWMLCLAAILLLFPWLLGPRAGQTPLDVHGPLLILWWLNRLYCGFWHRLDLSEAHALPDRGPVLLVANHTCGIDHMLLQASTRRALGFMIAQEYYDWPICRPFCRITKCIPVKRDGRDLSATRAALRALKEGRVVPIFPEGTILPTSGREFGPARPGAAFIALRSGVPVIPAYISGTPETNDILKSLRTPSNAKVVFGPPIDLSDLALPDGEERHRIDEATRRIMDAIKRLRDLSGQGEDGVVLNGHPEARPDTVVV